MPPPRLRRLSPLIILWVLFQNCLSFSSMKPWGILGLHHMKPRTNNVWTTAQRHPRLYASINEDCEDLARITQRERDLRIPDDYGRRLTLQTMLALPLLAPFSAWAAEGPTPSVGQESRSLRQRVEGNAVTPTPYVLHVTTC